MAQLQWRRQLRFLPVATIYFCFLNVAFYVKTVTSGQEVEILRNFGFSPSEALASLALPHAAFGTEPLAYPLQSLMSYMFLHTDIVHLSLNLIGLLYFGFIVEKEIGSVKLIGSYLAAGIFSGIVFGLAALLFQPNNALLVGASGAVCGLVGLAAALGKTKAYYWIIAETGTAIIAYFMSIPVGYGAHIAGFAFGFILGTAIMKLGVNKYKKRNELEAFAS